MTDTEIRIAIAEKCGWVRGKHFEQILPTGEGENWDGWIDPKTSEFEFEPPDYPNDLNACHEFEKTLTLQQKHDYYTFLWKLIVADMPHIRTDAHLWANVSATARQRCEAFLRVHGLWKE